MSPSLGTSLRQRDRKTKKVEMDSGDGRQSSSRHRSVDNNVGKTKFSQEGEFQTLCDTRWTTPNLSWNENTRHSNVVYPPKENSVKKKVHLMGLFLR